MRKKFLGFRQFSHLKCQNALWYDGNFLIDSIMFVMFYSL